MEDQWFNMIQIITAQSKLFEKVGMGWDLKDGPKI